MTKRSALATALAVLFSASPALAQTGGDVLASATLKYRPIMWQQADTSHGEQSISYGNCQLVVNTAKVSPDGSVPVSVERTTFALADVNTKLFVNPDPTVLTDAKTREGAIEVETLVADDFLNVPYQVPAFEVTLYTAGGKETVKHISEHQGGSFVLQTAPAGTAPPAAAVPGGTAPLQVAVTREVSMEASGDFMLTGDQQTMQRFVGWLVETSKACGAVGPAFSAAPPAGSKSANAEPVAAAASSASTPAAGAPSATTADKTLAAGVSAGPDQAERAVKFFIHNKGDTAINDLEIAKLQGAWSANVFSNPLNPGFFRQITVPAAYLSSACHARIKAALADGQVLIKRDVNLCASPHVNYP